MPLGKLGNLGQTYTSPGGYTSPGNYASPGGAYSYYTSPGQTTVPASVPITPGLFGQGTYMNPQGFPTPPGSAGSGSGGGSSGGGGSPSGGGGSPSGGQQQQQQPRLLQTPNLLRSGANSGSPQVLILSPNSGPYGNLSPLSPYGGGYGNQGTLSPYAGPYYTGGTTRSPSLYGSSATGSLTQQLTATVTKYWPWLLGGAVLLLVVSNRGSHRV
jgi:hypothetical protein